MPFRNIGRGKFKSPSGRVYTAKQVKLYYSTGGFKHFKGLRKKSLKRR